MKKIDVKDYAQQIFTQLPKGALLNTKADGKSNTMTIGWGGLGTDFQKTVFTIYVRASRFSKELLDKNAEFTVSFPLGEASEEQKKILGVCGTKSGRNMDKFKELGLHVVKGREVSTPAIKEFPLTLECKVVFKQQKKIALVAPEYQGVYPMLDIENKVGKVQDPHYVFEGEVVNAYIVE